MRSGFLLFAVETSGVSRGVLVTPRAILPAPVRGYVQFAAEARSYFGYAQVRT